MSTIASVHPFAPMIGAQYINLTTYRKSGVPVATPLWFVENTGTLYAQTPETTGKIKRIHHNAHVLIATCTSNGTATSLPVKAIARIVNDSDEESLAEQLLNAKYGIRRKIFLSMFDISRMMRRQLKPPMVTLAFELGDPNYQTDQTT